MPKPISKAQQRLIALDKAECDYLINAGWIMVKDIEYRDWYTPGTDVSKVDENTDVYDHEFALKEQRHIDNCLDIDDIKKCHHAKFACQKNDFK